MGHSSVIAQELKMKIWSARPIRSKNRGTNVSGWCVYEAAQTDCFTSSVLSQGWVKRHELLHRWWVGTGKGDATFENAETLLSNHHLLTQTMTQNELRSQGYHVTTGEKRTRVSRPQPALIFVQPKLRMFLKRVWNSRKSVTVREVASGLGCSLSGVYWKHLLPPGQRTGALTQWKWIHIQLPIIKTQNILLGPWNNVWIRKRKLLRKQRGISPFPEYIFLLYRTVVTKPFIWLVWLSKLSSEIELLLSVGNRPRRLKWVAQGLRLTHWFQTQVDWFEDQAI